jgi:hypothetical protein
MTNKVNRCLSVIGNTNISLIAHTITGDKFKIIASSSTFGDAGAFKSSKLIKYNH